VQEVVTNINGSLEAIVEISLRRGNEPTSILAVADICTYSGQLFAGIEKIV